MSQETTPKTVLWFIWRRLSEKLFRKHAAPDRQCEQSEAGPDDAEEQRFHREERRHLLQDLGEAPSCRRRSSSAIAAREAKRS